MSETKSESMTHVVGYFNPHPYSIFIEISEINLKVELKPKIFIRDRNGNKINDPIFDAYVHAKGLSKATSETPVPVIYAPRLVKSTRPAHSVTQAKGFVRQPDGKVVPEFSRQPAQVPTEGQINKNPITGMTVEKARQLGLIGKPKIIPEEYGIPETTGAPITKDLPDIKYSTETPPRIRTGASMRPQLTESQEIPPAQPPAPVSPEERPPAPKTPARRPIRMKAPEEPKAINLPKPMPRPEPPTGTASPTVVKPKTQVVPPKPTPEATPERVLPQRKVAAVVEPEAEQEEQGAEQVEEVQQEEQIDDQSGIVEPLGESSMPNPVPESPEASESGKRFICAADGKAFDYRSDLERYVKRKFPDMLDDLMAPYPPQ